MNEMNLRYYTILRTLLIYTHFTALLGQPYKRLLKNRGHDIVPGEQCHTPHGVVITEYRAMVE
jgi:hypothetical protein